MASKIAASLIREGPALGIAGTSLVVPTLSLGSIDQLALDLLINSLYVQSPGSIIRLGRLVTSFVQPVVGGPPFEGREGDALAFSLEVYLVPDSRVVILQQRAPAVQDLHEAFVLSILQWAAEEGVATFTMLSAIDGISRLDADFAATSPLRYFAVSEDPAAEAAGALRVSHERVAESNLYDVTATVFGADGSVVGSSDSKPSRPVLPGWIPLSARSVFQTASAFRGIWGSGYAPIYYRRAISEAYPSDLPPLPSLRSCLAVIASEGVNIPHASALAELAVQVLGLSSLLPGHSQRKAGTVSGVLVPKTIGRFNTPQFWIRTAEADSEVDVFLYA